MSTFPSTHRVESVQRTRPQSYPGLPTGWGRWPTCACPRGGAADSSCRDLLSTIR